MARKPKKAKNKPKKRVRFHPDMARQPEIIDRERENKKDKERRRTTDSIDKILEFAIAREVEANQLYLYMARRMKNPEMRQVCEDLAKEELEHRAKLELELMKRGQVVSSLDISDYMIEVGSEIDMGYKELLSFAIKKEQTAIDLYTHLASIVKDKDSHKVLLLLAEEETEHKQLFEIEYNRVLKVK